MKWTPISKDALLAEIARSVALLTEEAQTRWRTMAVDPVKWACSPWGDQGGGFWIVAINDESVIWYNDIEDGFDVSAYTELGRIENYACNQFELSMIFGGGLA